MHTGLLVIRHGSFYRKLAEPCSSLLEKSGTESSIRGGALPMNLHMFSLSKRQFNVNQ